VLLLAPSVDKFVGIAEFDAGRSLWAGRVCNATTSRGIVSRLVAESVNGTANAQMVTVTVIRTWYCRRSDRKLECSGERATSRAYLDLKHATCSGHPVRWALQRRYPCLVEMTCRLVRS